MQRKPSVGALLFGAVAIGTYCVLVSGHRILWSDELFSWVLLTDPSLRHMLLAWRGGADGGGIAFYLLGRLWLHIFGASHLAYRTFSATGSFVAWAVLWFTLTRFYRGWIAFFALCAVWFGSDVMLWQMVQTRFYGMLLAAGALALYVAARNLHSHEYAAHSQAWHATATLAVNLLLVNVHPLGIFNSACILLGVFLADRLEGRWRPWQYIATIAAWPSLLLSHEALLSSAANGKPWFWTTRPHLSDLLELWNPFSDMQPDSIAWLMNSAIAGLILLAIIAACLPSVRRSARARIRLLLPATALALSPILFFFLSQRGTSILVDRYLICGLLGVTVLLAETVTQISQRIASSKPSQLVGRAVLTAVLLFAAVKSLWFYPSHLQKPMPDFTATIAAQVGRSPLPLVIPRVDICDVMIAEPTSADIHPVCPLDWAYVISPLARRGDVSGYHELANWRRFGYHSQAIVPIDTLLHDNPRFLVLETAPAPWLHYKLLTSPKWTAVFLHEVHSETLNAELWAVTRLP